MKKFFAIAMLLSLVTLPMCSQEESKDERSLSEVLIEALRNVNASVSSDVNNIPRSVKSLQLAKEVISNNIVIDEGLQVLINGNVNVTPSLDENGTGTVGVKGNLTITIKFTNYASGDFTLNGELTEDYNLLETIDLVSGQQTSMIIDGDFTYNGTINVSGKESGEVTFSNLEFKFSGSSSGNTTTPIFTSTYSSGSVTINGTDITDQFKNMPM